MWARLGLFALFLSGLIGLGVLGGIAGQGFPADFTDIEQFDEWSPCQAPCPVSNVVMDGIAALGTYTPPETKNLTEPEQNALAGMRDGIEKQDFGLLLSWANILHNEMTARGKDTWDALESLLPIFAGQIILRSLPGLPFGIFLVLAFWSVYGFTTRLWVNPVGWADKALSAIPGINSLLGFLKTMATLFVFVLALIWGTWMGSNHPATLFAINEALVLIILWSWVLWFISLFTLAPERRRRRKEKEEQDMDWRHRLPPRNEPHL